MPAMLSIVVSTFVYFVASWYIKRYLEGIGIPKGLTRGAVIFSSALLIAYGVAVLVDWLVSRAG
ncbi:MAG: hypothetical protein ACREUW_04495 [Burkholderiales bacterium]